MASEGDSYVKISPRSILSVPDTSPKITGQLGNQSVYYEKQYAYRHGMSHLELPLSL